LKTQDDIEDLASNRRIRIALCVVVLFVVGREGRLQRCFERNGLNLLATAVVARRHIRVDLPATDTLAVLAAPFREVAIAGILREDALPVLDGKDLGGLGSPLAEFETVSHYLYIRRFGKGPGFVGGDEEDARLFSGDDNRHSDLRGRGRLNPARDNCLQDVPGAIGMTLELPGVSGGLIGVGAVLEEKLGRLAEKGSQRELNTAPGVKCKERNG
jgi:hypothetical protein